MANNKWAGYAPKKETTIPNEGAPGSGTHLDRVNPFEFRKGMDIELTSLGVSRLAESTPEEREKCTETVLKNLTEHDGYYTALVTYQTEHRNVEKKPAFKQWLAEQGETQMKEVTQEFKNDKMTELKEAIKSEIKNILSEFKEEVDPKKAAKINKADAKKDRDDKKASVNNAKTKARALDTLNKDEQKAKDKKKALQNEFKPAMVKYNEDGDKAAYEAKVGDIPDQIKQINIQLKDFEKQREDINLKEKQDKKDVATLAMDKDTHMALLEIIKEHGVNLREGADGVKMYYEIAKSAYMEGLTAGMKVN